MGSKGAMGHVGITREAIWGSPTIIYNGTAASATATTLVDSTQAWTASVLIGLFIRITGGTGVGQVKVITANDATSVTVATWDTNPDSTSTYEIYRVVDNVVEVHTPQGVMEYEVLSVDLI